MGKFQDGQLVTTSGYAGRVVRYYSTRMVEVMLESGLVCVDENDIMDASAPASATEERAAP